MSINMNYILNGTPEKRIKNGYNQMKLNYTSESADNYFDIYSKEHLHTVLENSNIIFSEPYRGTLFYEHIMSDNLCCFSSIPDEIYKVNMYIESFYESMSTKQQTIIDNLQKTLNVVSERTKNTQLYASYIKENIDSNFEYNLSEALYTYERSDDKNTEEIIELFENVESPIIFFTYTPYIAERVGSDVLNNLTTVFLEVVDVPEEFDDEQWKSYVESVICCNKLKNDEAYIEAIRTIQNRNVRAIFEYYMESSISNILNELITKREVDISLSESRTSAVNNIFTDMYESQIDSEVNDTNRLQYNTYYAIAYESTLNMIIHEYQTMEDDSINAIGYSILNSDMTLTEAFEYTNNNYIKYSSLIEEKEDNNEIEEEDVSDEDIEDMDNDIRDGYDAGKKPKAPKPKNLANKIQFKAMDAEVKQMKRQALRGQKGQEIRNATKAVSKLPKNVIDSIDKTVKELDEKDDERRKNFMASPGYRKKIFRNFKLALMYGTAAQVKLSYVPLVGLLRHFSKHKDRRIRNELVRELETERKVCEEMISDSTGREKYNLMRTRDRLDAEIVRVKTNSKYV